MLVHDYLDDIVIVDELIHVHHLILFHFEISRKQKNTKLFLILKKTKTKYEYKPFLVKNDIHLQLKYIFVDIHQVYVLIHHVHQVINDDQVQVEYVDNEDDRTKIEYFLFI
jgi:hypothetical protein